VTGFDPEIPERDYRPIHPEPAWREVARRIWAPIVVVAGLVAKFGVAAAKFWTIFAAIGGYALIWGWKFGVGLVGLILVHELGHFFEAKRRGLDPDLPVFHLLGAYVALRNPIMGPWQKFWVSLSGPLWGSVVAAAIWLVGEQQDSRLLMALGYAGFMLNLFNLIPIGFLDGGSIWRAIRTMRRGGTPGQAAFGALLYGGLAVLLVLGMVAAHVPQHRL
jgi:Zn-dependent protease